MANISIKSIMKGLTAILIIDLVVFIVYGWFEATRYIHMQPIDFENTYSIQYEGYILNPFLLQCAKRNQNNKIISQNGESFEITIGNCLKNTNYVIRKK